MNIGHIRFGNPVSFGRYVAEQVNKIVCEGAADHVLLTGPHCREREGGKAVSFQATAVLPDGTTSHLASLDYLCGKGNSEKSCGQKGRENYHCFCLKGVVEEIVGFDPAIKSILSGEGTYKIF